MWAAGSRSPAAHASHSLPLPAALCAAVYSQKTFANPAELPLHQIKLPDGFKIHLYTNQSGGCRGDCARAGCGLQQAHCHGLPRAAPTHAAQRRQHQQGVLAGWQHQLRCGWHMQRCGWPCRLMTANSCSPLCAPSPQSLPHGQWRSLALQTRRELWTMCRSHMLPCLFLPAMAQPRMLNSIADLRSSDRIFTPPPCSPAAPPLCMSGRMRRARTAM